MINPHIVREIIYDFRQHELPQFTRRQINLECPRNKIRTLIGARRVGKTFSLYQIISDLLSQNIPRERILFINFEDERLIPLEVKDLTLILNTYYEIYPNNKDNIVYLFFDEIQNVPGWEIFIRRIHDSEKIQINLTGSSSKLLSSDIATSLRGRTLSFEIFPFSFNEFLKFRGITTNPLSSKNRSFIINAFNSYLLSGGYPEILDVQEQMRIKILQDYFNLVLYKDLIERYDIRNHSLMKYFLKFILANSANPFSVNKVFGDIKSQGYKLSKDTLHNYLSYLEQSLLIHQVPIFSESLRKQHINYRKIYSLDHGLITSIVNSQSYNRGRLIETMVYNQLRRTYEHDQIYYYRTSLNQEIDFLVNDRGKILNLIQVSEQLNTPKTRSREISALNQSMRELKAKYAWLITSNEKEDIHSPEGTIKVIPFWEWVISG
ncbi:MAG TPA: ATP-binding protein [bacterium]|mgnify:CR=1 FL=1|nr:ATP-binding protein [bacterium]